MATSIQQDLKMIAGGGQNKPVVNVSPRDKEHLRQEYAKVFYGLTYKELIAGNTLAKAWFIALHNLEKIINMKNKNNPAAMFLSQYLAAHKISQSKEIMTSPLKNKTLDKMPDNIKAEKLTVANNLNHFGQNEITRILGHYEPQQNKPDPRKVGIIKPAPIMTREQVIKIVVSHKLAQLH